MKNRSFFEKRPYGSIPVHETEALQNSRDFTNDPSPPTNAMVFRTLVLATLVATMTVMSLNSTPQPDTANTTITSLSEEVQGAPSIDSMSLKERMDQWDQFKSKLEDWMHATEQTYEQLATNVHDDSEAIWNATSLPMKDSLESTDNVRTDVWNVTSQGAKHGWNVTGTWAKDRWNDTTHGVEHAGEATGEKASLRWNSTVNGVGQAGESAVEGIEGLWNKTAQFSGQTGEATSNAAKGSWNKTTSFAKHAEEATIEEADVIWNKTVHGTEHGEEAVKDLFVHAEDESKLFLNETSHKMGDLIHKEGQSIENWWSHTQYSTKTWWDDRVVWWKNTTSPTSTAEAAPALVFLNNTYGYSLLTNGMGKWLDYSQDYFLYQQGWDAQINQAYCAVATSAALLNSFRDQGIVLPQDPIYDPHPYATQSSLFNTCTELQVITRNDTFDGIFHTPGGLGMLQTIALLKCWVPEGWTVTGYHVDPAQLTIDTVRHDIRQALQNPAARVMINYDRASVGQLGGGHWSPLGSYSSDRDAVLVMDVAKYKYPAVWIPLATLYNSLSTYDTCGQWDFPTAQLALKDKYLKPTNEEDYHLSMTMLGCTALRRGYIIVQKNEA